MKDLLGSHLGQCPVVIIIIIIIIIFNWLDLVIISFIHFKFMKYSDICDCNLYINQLLKQWNGKNNTIFNIPLQSFFSIVLFYLPFLTVRLYQWFLSNANNLLTISSIPTS